MCCGKFWAKRRHVKREGEARVVENTAFDDHKAKRLAIIEAGRARLAEEERAFDRFREERRKAEDRETFERFKTEQHPPEALL